MDRTNDGVIYGDEVLGDKLALWWGGLITGLDFVVIISTGWTCEKDW